MLLTADPDVARHFCTSFALFQSFILSVELLAGAKIDERRLAVEDIATATYVHHERLHNAKL